MDDPLSIASSVVALVTFALQSSVVLYSTVRSFQSQDKDVLALKGEVNDLTTVLECLLDTVTKHPELDFAALKTHSIAMERIARSSQPSIQDSDY
ncbi:unnamed protein product [Clonostachys rhizophaga]|uniref:Azaphilone pigments biosynthesis cluster protein L N-terminal domain-containing protein n=1 Tax=Clonostachys rhizophaga TaxID=160324 RepID=A0A9N9VAX9_9HYPO|nr:unnamed protein product [Clonostachys rhizophaga]